MSGASAASLTPSPAPSQLSARNVGHLWWRSMRVVVVAGVPVGIIVGGLGSRLAMFVLRLSSPDSVRGVESDDGFTIGRFTLSGTLNLWLLGAAVGVIGAVAYLLVRPWLLGPPAFRYVSVGLACGAVVGSMLLHADGVDFALLKPKWFAMALFIALPALFGLVIGPAVEAVEKRRVPPGARQFVAPIALLLIAPFAVMPLLFLAPVVLLYSVLRISASAASGDVGSVPTVGRFAIRGVACHCVGWIGRRYRRHPGHHRPELGTAFGKENGRA